MRKERYVIMLKVSSKEVFEKVLCEVYDIKKRYKAKVYYVKAK